MNGAESLARTLVAGGVDVCFTNPGTSEMHFVAALDRVEGIRCVLGLFEGVVTGAADGYWRMADRPAATLLHLGPGLGNGLANLHNARKAASGIVNIVGEHATYHVKHDAPLTSDIEGIARPVSAWVRTSSSARAVAADGAAAIVAARTAPGQIATLILPADTAWNEADGVAPVPTVPPRAAVGAAAIEGSAAALRSGEPAINRSPMLSIRTASATGVTRADLPPSNAAADDSPLFLKAFQAYDFAAVPFAVRLAVEPVSLKTSAVVQTIVRLAERERKFESGILFTAEGRPLYRARLVLPQDFRLDHVQALVAQVLVAFEWAVTEEAGRKVLTVYLGKGVNGAVSIQLDGKLGEGAMLQMPLPRIEVLDVDRQEGDTVVQVDPALEIRAEALTNVESVPLARTFGWLNDTQRPLAQLALHHTRPDYSARLVLTARRPDVGCFTVSNSRVTDRTIQDTILLDWTIKNAGIKEVVFLLPAWMKDSRISVPLLREKTVKPVDDKPGSPVRVRLQLQDHPAPGRTRRPTALPGRLSRQCPSSPANRACPG